eukprot:1159695-Pelagomonas_calceolata.AAC.6
MPLYYLIMRSCCEGRVAGGKVKVMPEVEQRAGRKDPKFSGWLVQGTNIAGKTGHCSASYKEQVAKLAEQLARLYKQQAGAWSWGGVDAGPLKMAAQEHTRCGAQGLTGRGRWAPENGCTRANKVRDSALGCRIVSVPIRLGKMASPQAVALAVCTASPQAVALAVCAASPQNITSSTNT